MIEVNHQMSFEEIIGACISLKNVKQSRYKRGDDPLSAFIESSKRANIPTLNLIFARIVDKEGRIANYLQDEAVDAIGITEELMDTINYSVFAIMALQRLINVVPDNDTDDIVPMRNVKPVKIEPLGKGMLIKRVIEDDQDLSS